MASKKKAEVKTPGIDREALKAELLAELKAEMEVKPEVKPEPVKDAYLEEYVEVKLFKDNDKYKDDVFVAVNGERCQIKRGYPVKIKRKFALVLEMQERQDFETAEMISRQSAEFTQEAATRGI